jgi:hypothetical protein
LNTNEPLQIVVTADSFNVLKDFLVPLLAAIIGGGLALLGARLSDKQNQKRDKISRQEKINGVLLAVKFELEILEEIYMRNIGSDVEGIAVKGVLDRPLSLKNKYFIVYPENTHIVGQIMNQELVKSVIVTYNTANALIDAIWVNNSLIEDEKEAVNKMNEEKTASEGSFRSRYPREVFTFKKISQAKLVESLHYNLRAEKQKVVKLIDEYVLANKTNETASVFGIYWGEILNRLVSVWDKFVKEINQ